MCSCDLCGPGPHPRDRKPVLSDLFDVGPNKPLGYLPIRTIQNIAPVAQVETRCLMAGNCAVQLSEDDSLVGGGALFVYDPVALAALLDQNRNILREAGWPSEPLPFIHRLWETAPPHTELFNVIADAFGDHTNGNRK